MIKNNFLFLLLVIAFQVTSIQAQDHYSIGIGLSEASQNDLGQILSGSTTPTDPKAHTMGINVGWLWLENSGNIPLDFYLKSGVNKFLEPQVDGFDDLYELTVYIKAYYKVNFWSNQIRLGFGEGASYALSIPYVEYQEAQAENGKNSKYLNYLEISIDFDIARALSIGKEFYVGYKLKHRSGIYGLINGVNKGGSNYNMITLEANF